MMSAEDDVPAAGAFALVLCHCLLCSNAGKIYCTADLEQLLFHDLLFSGYNC